MGRMARTVAGGVGLLLVISVALPAAAEGVYECPGLPMRYTDGADDPYCRWIELSEQKLIKIDPSPFAPERDLRPHEPEGPLRPLAERAPVFDGDCDLYREWQDLHAPLSGNGPSEISRRQQLDRYFKLRANPPRCPR